MRRCGSDAATPNQCRAAAITFGSISTSSTSIAGAAHSSDRAARPHAEHEKTVRIDQQRPKCELTVIKARGAPRSGRAGIYGPRGETDAAFVCQQADDDRPNDGKCHHRQGKDCDRRQRRANKVALQREARQEGSHGVENQGSGPSRSLIGRYRRGIGRVGIDHTKARRDMGVEESDLFC